MNQLDQLKAYTTVVADTGNFMQLTAYAPRDATTSTCVRSTRYTSSSVCI